MQLTRFQSTGLVCSFPLGRLVLQGLTLLTTGLRSSYVTELLSLRDNTISSKAGLVCSSIFKISAQKNSTFTVQKTQHELEAPSLLPLHLGKANGNTQTNISFSTLPVRNRQCAGKWHKGLLLMLSL